MRKSLGLLSLYMCSALATTAVAGTFESSDGGEGIAELPFKVNMNVRGGYDDNVNTASGNVVRNPFTGEVAYIDEKEDSMFVGANIDFSRAFGGPRTKLTLGLGAGVTYYFDLPSDDVDYNFRINSRLNHKFNRKFSLDAYAKLAYMTEPDFFNQAVVTRSRRSGHYFYANAGLTLNYQWRRKFSTRTGYHFTAIRYDDSIFQAIDDRYEHSFRQEFRYLIHPKTTLLAEYRYGIVDYVDNPRNSTSHYALAGFEHSFTPKFNLSVRGGAEWRSYDIGQNQTKPYGEGTLSYSYAERSSLSWVFRYGIENNDALLSNNVTFRTGVRLIHGFSPKLSGNVSFYYQNSDYSSPIISDYTDNLYQLNAGLTYYITRRFNVGAYYSYTRQDSGISVREYDRNRISLGAGLSF